MTGLSDEELSNLTTSNEVGNILHNRQEFFVTPMGISVSLMSLFFFQFQAGQKSEQALVENVNHSPGKTQSGSQKCDDKAEASKSDEEITVISLDIQNILSKLFDPWKVLMCLSRFPGINGGPGQQLEITFK